MKLLADESVDRQIVARLRQNAHDCVYVAELSPSITDNEVLQEGASGPRRRTARRIQRDFTRCHPSSETP